MTVCNLKASLQLSSEGIITVDKVEGLLTRVSIEVFHIGTLIPTKPEDDWQKTAIN